MKSLYYTFLACIVLSVAAVATISGSTKSTQNQIADLRINEVRLTEDSEEAILTSDDNYGRPHLLKRRPQLRRHPRK